MLRFRLLLLLFVIGSCYRLVPVHAQLGELPKKAEASKPKAAEDLSAPGAANNDSPTKNAELATVPVAKPDGLVPFLTRLADDSQIKIEITEPTITIATKYGLLKIPTAEIKRLEIGLRYPPGLEAKLEEAIRDLGNDAFGVRDAAEKKLLGYQELALPTIRAAVKDSDKEISSRAKRMLEQLQSSLPEEKFTRKTSDLIVTDEFTARGKIELPELAVKSKIFGPAKLALHEIRNARSIAGTDNSEVTIDAAQYGKPNRAAWMDTNYDVESDNGLQIEASGQVDLLPQNPGQMVCGPTGFPAMNRATAIPTARRSELQTGRS